MQKLARLRRPLSIASVMLLIVGLFATTGGVAGAAPGDASPLLPTKTVAPAVAQGGEIIQYTVNFTCSNNEDDLPQDGCDGAQFSDPIPKFTNTYGEQMPLEFVSATGPASVWPGGFTLNAVDPANPFIQSTAGAFPPGTSGSIFITLRVPASMVPDGNQSITNVATVTDSDDGQVNSSPEAVSQISGTAPSWTIAKDGPGTGTRLNRNYEWRISVCGPGTSALWPEYSITDTLPEGFQFVSAERGGVYTDDAPTPGVSDGAATVTWTFDGTNRPPLGTDGCFRFKVTGRFPSSHPSNIGAATKTNTATGLGKANSADPGVGIGTAPWTTTLVGPTFGSASTAKNFTDLQNRNNFYVAHGETARFNLSAAVDSDFLLDSVTLTDGSWTFNDGTNPATSGTGLPPSFTATSIDPGTWNDPGTATIEGSNDNFLTTNVVASNVASGAVDIPLSPAYRSYRWIWSGPGIRGDFQATGMFIAGTIVGGPANANGTYVNISTLNVVPNGSAAVSRTASDNYILENTLPLPAITKTASNPNRQPGQEVTYSLRVTNNIDSTGSLTNPVISDCIPQYLLLQGSATTPGSWVAGPGTTCGAGETPLSFQWNGTLAPGAQTSVITYTVLVATSDPGPVAPYGTYTNTAIVSPGGGGSFAHCVNTAPVCGARAVVSITPTVELRSQKCVKGELDAVFRPSPRCASGEPEITPALTTPGGGITYKLDLNNVGNTDADNIEFIDTFPHVGDTAVITGGTVLNPRRSEYAPILVSPIVAPTGWTVSYSTSANPCRGEVGGPNSPGTNCEDPAWTTTPDLLAISSYQSIKLSHPGVIAKGETASFTWNMRAPVIDSVYDVGGTVPSDPYEALHGCASYAPRTDPHCPRAVNSFAYGADAANLPGGTPQPSRLTAEPPQVEVRVIDPQFANAIGDRVWYDRNFDGIQATDTSPSGEPGIAGVLVRLHQADGTLVAETYTDSGGFYLFDSVGGSALPDGDYYLRFYPPAGWVISPQNAAGSTTENDSDIPRIPTATDGTGTYHQTATTTLGDDKNFDVDGDGTPDGEKDLSWDAGLWRSEANVDIDKVTRDSAWPASAAGDGVTILQARPVTWTYKITNTGNSRLENVSINDDGGPGAGFAVTSCVILDNGQNAFDNPSTVTPTIALNRGAVIECTATGTAGAVDYSNLGTVSGQPAQDDGTVITESPVGYPPPTTVTADDPSSYVAGWYDLALAKMTSAINVATGAVTFDIVVQNQGTVPSGDYSITDMLPDGLSFVSADPAPSSVDGNKIVWDLNGLSPLATRTITLNVKIDDYLKAPFRNHAEISADGAASVVTGGVLTPTVDRDSTPGDNPVNGDDSYYGPVGDSTAADNKSIAEAGVGADTEDDEDIADVDLNIVYDLALAKTATSTPFTADSPATTTYSVTVENQGTVDSGSYTVTDTLPAGVSPVSPIADDGVFDADGGFFEVDGGIVTWTGLNLKPGETKTFTLKVTVDNLMLQPFRNYAEISSDSAQALYGVDDIDSTPDADPTNDNDGNGVDEGYGYGPVGSPDPEVDNQTTADAGNGNDGEDDADIADVTIPLANAYDLALIKTAASPTVAPDGTITYTITVQNQGALDSREFKVTDVLPAGIDAVDLAGGTDNGDGTVTWTVENLAPGASMTITFTAKITDLTKRPFVNFAEITDDSADTYSTPGDTVRDRDSVPGDEETNGVENNSIEEAGVGDDEGFDDEDIATVTTNIVYDLTLVKRLLPGQRFRLGDVIRYELDVTNNGNVPSGIYSVKDDLPAGLEFVSGSNGAAASGQVVSWADLPSLAPGEKATLAIEAKLVDVTQSGYVNTAGITSDSADSYSTEDEKVTDKDSPPGEVLGADYDDEVALPMEQVRSDNEERPGTPPPPTPPGVDQPGGSGGPPPAQSGRTSEQPTRSGSLPYTGGTVGGLLLLGALLAAGGLALSRAGRKRTT